MENTTSRVTIHMAASLDGFIARKDGSVDWLETSDKFEGGDTMTPEFVEEFLKTIDCYVMGSRTYETALEFEAKGLGWSYGDKPTFVLTSRELKKTRETVEFYTGELALLVDERLKPHFRNIWFVGGGEVSGECLRLGLADEVRYSIMPILIGDGISFFDRLDKDVTLHLVEAKTYDSGMVALRYEVRMETAGATMSIEKVKPDAGKGGKLGRSNMAYWGTNDEAKAAGRKLRRQAGRQAVEEGVADAVAPDRTIQRRKKPKAAR